MINLLLGAPGGGKSYEAVVFHVLTALQQGRKVITNLPLFIDKVALIEPRAFELIEQRREHRTIKGKLPFSTLEEYGDPWRHPDNGGGALYIIDESHKVLPVDDTPRELEEWYAEHRHEVCDVLLITQSYGKMSKAVRDAVQVVYRVRKKVAWGQPDRYIRKVQDGIRGEVMAVSERVYEKKYFPLYKSHTKNNGLAGFEFGAVDIDPKYKKVIRAGIGVCLVAALIIGWKLLRGNSPEAEQARVRAVRVVESAGKHVASPAAPVRVSAPSAAPSPSVSAPAQVDHPFRGLRMHIAGALRSGERFEYVVLLSQNGQVVQQVTVAELRAAGYTVEWVNECAARITWPEITPWFARCDYPVQQIVKKDQS